ncbi:putative LRR receptor-like serine/threonine-protein kinase [Apostasia shenzhenica]|uniref:Receptor kinase-like protein Xa21 n=1 Tax=Apostasia shenzhenica TaxID=1088818 RepID=A0A2I0ATY6_9ASPA|nr:putative LRR receptor-like serine/threonine-protein kinase [Apostasia shenzhenica]
MDLQSCFKLSFLLLFFSFTASRNSSSDQASLLSFKSMVISDPSGALTSWNEATRISNWQGIFCGSRRHPGRVTALELPSMNLSGTLSSSLANLSLLQKIDLSGNNFKGKLPVELGSLVRLHYINMNFNSLEGGIPSTLSHCAKLQKLSLSDNQLNGEIPQNLGLLLRFQSISLRNNKLVGGIPSSFMNLSSLLYLDLSNNSLTGSLPAALGNLSALSYLDLSSNHLQGSIPNLENLMHFTHMDLSQNNLVGGIPPYIANLSSLTTLYLADNSLTGEIPHSIWSLSSLSVFGVQNNNLSGSLPPEMGNSLPNLRTLDLYNNQFHGNIPRSLCNASSLRIIDLSFNKFSGRIPPNLGALENLRTVILTDNSLEAKEEVDWYFLKSLTNCTSLKGLQLDRNNLGGNLPNFVANLSTLTWLSMGGNQIFGSLQMEIGNLINLTLLDVGPNLLSGAIPATLGRLQNLHILDLNGNSFTGEIPTSIGNLSHLNQLYLGFNALSGNIPTSIGDLLSLEYLSLDYNRLSGLIPKEIFSISTLSILLGLSHNSLMGPMPSEVGTLRNLNMLDVSENKLTGEIPSAIGECLLLEILLMRGNFFNGSIPSSMKELKGLQHLDLSNNNMSGHIPDFLGTFHLLQELNLSFNNFNGEVPKKGIFGNASAFSVLGNSDLCGGSTKLNLPPCLNQTPMKKHKSKQIILIIFSVTTLFLILLFSSIGTYYYRAKKSKTVDLDKFVLKNQLKKVSYYELFKATNGFSPENLIGEGSFGSVYKGSMNLDSEKEVAIKVLNLQQKGALKSFFAECEALRNIRHRNLVKILTSCSSTDFRGNEFKAMVFEFLPNESLEKWLHPEEDEGDLKMLNLSQRLNIAVDVGLALEYLHCHGNAPIVHCDLKPSNVLLDYDMIAHVGDFGLARFLDLRASRSIKNPSCSTNLKGSIGYVAPEYGVANEISTKGDVYSYGILLLEMFTGRRPTDESFKEGLNLHKYVDKAFPNEVMETVDSSISLLPQQGEQIHDQAALRCIISVLRIGLLCSRESPMERMGIAEVAKELQAVRDEYVRALT